MPDPKHPRRRTVIFGWAAAALGALLVLPWLFVMAVESDSGWEDAIWQGPSTSRTLAWLAFACGALAAGAALMCAERLGSGTGRRPGVWLATSLVLELTAAAGWIALMATAPA